VIKTTLGFRKLFLFVKKLKNGENLSVQDICKSKATIGRETSAPEPDVDEAEEDLKLYPEEPLPNQLSLLQGTNVKTLFYFVRHYNKIGCWVHCGSHFH
jgi:hypothetical protein